MVATTFDIVVILTTILINIIVLCISAHTLFHRNRQTITTPTLLEAIEASENTEPDLAIIDCDESIEAHLFLHFLLQKFYRLSKTDFGHVHLVRPHTEAAVYRPAVLDPSMDNMIYYQGCIMTVERIYDYPHPIIDIRDHGYFRLYGWKMYEGRCLHVLQPADNVDRSIYFYQTETDNIPHISMD